MKITCINFGGFAATNVELTSIVASNGYGKTTLVNAYTFALTGKCITGIEPRNTATPDGELTQVLLSGFADFPPLRRTLAREGSTTLYIGDEVATQGEFISLCNDRGLNLDLIVACADANVLTNVDITSEQLRKILSKTFVLDNGEADELRKELKTLRAKKKIAESNALLNVTKPVRTVGLLNHAENTFLMEYNKAISLIRAGVVTKCLTCGHALSKSVLEKAENDLNEAKEYVKGMDEEAERLQRQSDMYAKESLLIADAERIISGAALARADVAKYEVREKELEEAIKEADASAVRANLPEGVEIVTEKSTKTGTSKNVCTLTYNGIPLKSINRAKRIEICVELLHNARNKQGMDEVYPIIVDNAESVQGLQNIPNLIRFSVG